MEIQPDILHPTLNSLTDSCADTMYSPNAAVGALSQQPSSLASSNSKGNSLAAASSTDALLLS